MNNKVMSITLSKQLGFVPRRRANIKQIGMWAFSYETDLENIFNIFRNRLKDVEPFSEKDLDSDEFYDAFVKEIYNSSSGYIEYGGTEKID